MAPASSPLLAGAALAVSPREKLAAFQGWRDQVAWTLESDCGDAAHRLWSPAATPWFRRRAGGTPAAEVSGTLQKLFSLQLPSCDLPPTVISRRRSKQNPPTTRGFQQILMTHVTSLLTGLAAVTGSSPPSSVLGHPTSCREFRGSPSGQGRVCPASPLLSTKGQAGATPASLCSPRLQLPLFLPVLKAFPAPQTQLSFLHV